MILNVASAIIAKAFRSNFVMKGLASAVRRSSNHPSYEDPKISGTENLFYIVPGPELVIKESEYLQSLAGKCFKAKKENYLNFPFELTEWNYFLVWSRKAVIVLEPDIYMELLTLKPEEKIEADRIQRAIELFEEGRNPKNPFVIIKTYKVREAMWHLTEGRSYMAIFNLCREIQKTTPHILFMADNARISSLGLNNKIKSCEKDIFMDGWLETEDC